MKVLITGATGLIGNEIVRICEREDIPVNYLTTDKKKIVSKDNYQGYFWNPNTQEIDIACFEGITAIINLAGAAISKRWTSSYKQKILASRIDSLKTLRAGLDQVDSSQINSVICASAIGIYPSSLSNFYTEDSKEKDSSFLSEVSYAWEKEAENLNTYNFKLSVVRIGLVLSDKGGALVEMKKPIQMGLGAAFGSGDQWQSWIHSSDLARMFLFIIENELEGIYNGVSPNPVNNTKLVKEIAEVLRKPLFLPNIPKFVMHMILGEMSNLLFASQRVSSKKIEEEGFVFNYQNIGRTLEHLLLQRNDSIVARSSQLKEFTS